MPAPGRSTFPRTFALALALHLAIAAWFVLAQAPGTPAAWTGFPLDDAWIHMVYGRSVAAHGAPLYNDTCEAGFTSPLWMLLLAVAHWCAWFAPAGAVFFAKAFGVVAAAAATAAIAELALLLTGARAVALLAGLLCALNPVLAFAQVSGMEVSLTTATSALAVLALARGQHGRAGLWLGLAYWSRPECLLLTALLAVVPFADRSVAERTRAGRAARLVAPTLVAGLLWSGYCLFATGHPLPNTFYAKFDLAADSDRWRAAVEVLGALPSNLLAVGIALAAASLLAVRRGPEGWLRTLLAAYPFVFLFAILRTRLSPVDAGSWFFFARYPAPAWPFLMLATALGAAALWQLGGTLSRPRLGLALRAGAALLAATTLLRSPAALARAATAYGWNCQNMNEVQVAFGPWVAANVPAGSAVALNDAGAIRYFGGRRAIDLIGLNDREVMFADPPVAVRCPDVDSWADWLRTRGADCAIIFPAWFPGRVREPRFAARFEPVQTYASEHYTVADPRSGQAKMLAYRIVDAAAAPR